MPFEEIVDNECRVVLSYSQSHRDYIDLTGAMTRVIVTVNGAVSAVFNADVTSAAPAIFSGGVIHQDNRPNTPETPALSFSIIQIFSGDARIEVQLQDMFFSGASLAYAGVQQVNFRIPAGRPTNTSDLRLCSTVATSPRVCSPPYRRAIRGQ